MEEEPSGDFSTAYYEAIDHVGHNFMPFLTRHGWSSCGQIFSKPSTE